MKKLLSVILTLTLILSALPLGIFSITASAATDGYYTYSVSNGEATITDVDTSISGSVTIPSTLGGYPVTSIGGDAFGGCTGLTSVTIPDSVTSIGACVFYDCTGLTSVTIGNGVRSIGSGAFDGCTGLTEVYITDLAAWCKTNFALAYYGPANPLEYAEKLYIDGVAATDITIPDSVTSIGDRAFMGYAGLTSVTIPDSVTSIGGDAFRGCTGLEKITVDSRNTVYHSSGNCLIETATKTLVMGCKNSVIPTDGSVTSIGKCAFYDCTGLTTVTIGNSVTSIGDSAFMGCTGLSSVTIPDSVTSIGGAAFMSCTSLTSVTIPDSVTSIGEYAFYGCDRLKDVYYRGNSSDKSEIYIGSINGPLTFATWYYNSCIGSATHNYILNGNLTCSGCKESKTPAAPTLYSKTDTTITLTAISGMEYSKDGTTWQSSPVFTGLTPGTTYTFYQRVAETDDYEVSDSSDALTTKTDKPPYTPGDLTGDEKIDTLDTHMLMRYLNGWKNLNIASPEAMDVNGDSEVDICDLVALHKKLV